MSALVQETLANADAAWARARADAAAAAYTKAQTGELPANAAAAREAQYAGAYATRAMVPSSIEERQAQAGMLGRQGQLLTAQAGQIGSLTPWQIAQMQASAGLAGTQAWQLGAMAPWQIALQRAQIGEMPSEEALRGSQAALGLAQAAWYRMMTGNPNPDVTPNPLYAPGNVGGYEEGGIIEPGWSKGGMPPPRIKATGPKSGPDDTVPALLAPGEAVLNKAAAEHLGRGLIAHLNALGLAKMASGAMPTTGQPAAAVGGEKKPTNSASPAKDKSAKGSAKKVKGYAAGDVSIEDDDDDLRGLDYSRYTQGLSKGSSKVTMPQTASRAPDRVPGYDDGTTLVGRMQGTPGGFIGLGGGILEGKNPFSQGYSQIPLVTNPNDWAGSPRVPDSGDSAAAATGRPPIIGGGGFAPMRSAPAGFTPAPVGNTGFRSIGPAMPFQSFEWGTEEVLPTTSLFTGAMTGQDAAAIAGRDKRTSDVDKEARNTVNGVSGMAKGNSKVRSGARSMRKSTTQAKPFAVQTPGQVALPAMSPMVQPPPIPQPSYPGNSFL